MSLEGRFWSKVRKTDTCWIWTGATRPDGYGVMGLGGRGEGIDRVHRISYRLHFGEIPVLTFVCHRCDNPRCVRPDHLFLGSAKDNHHDMRSKHRHVDPPRMLGDTNPRRIRPPRGALNPAAKLTSEDVRIARALSALGISGKEIGRMFSVSTSAACRAVKGDTW